MQSDSAAPQTGQAIRTTRVGNEATGEWPKSSVSYNNGWFQRNKIWVLAKLKGFLKEEDGKCVVNIPWNKCVKFGKSVHISEAYALRLVAGKTSIPVPKVISAFKKAGITYIVMQRVKGVSMNEVWADKMSQEDKDRVIGELRGYFEQLRQIPHPRPGTICTAAADDHPTFGFRTPHSRVGAGPFENEADFNAFLRSGKKYGRDEDLTKLIELHDKCHHLICFTHGDVASRNIMVKRSRSGQYHVAALIDFEMSGFFPEYWEYIAATVPRTGFGPKYWNVEVDKFLTPYPEELLMDRLRLSYFGRFGG